MVKIGIQGHPIRGKEVIQILESLSGINDALHEGGKIMTLDEFRKHTKEMRGDVEIMYHHAGGYYPVNTFRVLDDNNLVLCHKIYGQEDYLGILEAKVFLHKKEERK